MKIIHTKKSIKYLLTAREFHLLNNNSQKFKLLKELYKKKNKRNLK